MKVQTRLINNFREDLKREGFIDVTCYFEVKPRKFMIGANQIVNMETSNLVKIEDDGSCRLKQGDKKYYYWKIIEDQRKYNFECRTPFTVEDEGLDAVKEHLAKKGFIPLTYLPNIDPEKYMINERGVVIIVKGRGVGNEPPRDPMDENTCIYRIMIGDSEYVYRTNTELIECQLHHRTSGGY